MIDRNTYHETFSRLHASGDTVSEVLKMAREQEMRPSKKGLSRRALGALIAAAMALVLSVTAIAVSGTVYSSRPAERQISSGDWYDTAFGNEAVPGSEGGEAYFGDKEGYLPVPANQRVTVDADTARRLIGAETKNVDRAVTLGDWTFTVESLVLDENGIGVLTFTAENPNGVDGGLEVTADGEAMFNGEAGVKDQAGGKVTYPKFGLIAGHDGGTEASLDTRFYLSGEGRTATKVRLVAYMGAMWNVEALDGCDTLRAVFQITRPYKWRAVLDDLFPPGDDKLRETAVIDIPLTQMAQTVALSSADGWRAEVSPMGLVIYGSEAALAVSRHVGDEIDAVTVHYADGTEYVVTSEEPYIENNMLGYMPGDGSVRFVLNRLIDPSQIMSVTVSGGLYASTAGDKTPFETALTP